jgi:hypothetical protein
MGACWDRSVEDGGGGGGRFGLVWVGGGERIVEWALVRERGGRGENGMGDRSVMRSPCLDRQIGRSIYDQRRYPRFHGPHCLMPPTPTISHHIRPPSPRTSDRRVDDDVGGGNRVVGQQEHKGGEWHRGLAVQGEGHPRQEPQGAGDDDVGRAVEAQDGEGVAHQAV